MPEKDTDPKYYRETHQFGGKYGKYIECIDVIESLGLDFCLGNALKYVWRCGSKSDPIGDLAKATWYIRRWKNKRLKYPCSSSHPRR